MTRLALDELQTKTEWSTTTERLRWMALALTGSSEDADDLTQQTLLTLLVKKPDGADHIGYGRKTMLRLWMDRRRSLRRRLARLGRLAQVSTPWYVDRDKLCADDQGRRLHDAIEALPARQQAVLVLRLVEELDYAEIAKTLDCSVQTVRANLHLGRQRVRRQIGEPP